MDNYFELFQLPIKLPVDVSFLNEQFRLLQRKYHPDNFSLSSDGDKREMMQKSALINDGYVTLKNPISAAEHFLSLLPNNTLTENVTINDKDFLLEQFELREQLDELEFQNDYSKIDEFLDDVMQRKKMEYNQLLDYITNQSWSSAQQQIYKIRYLVKLIEQIEKLQEKQDAL